MKRPLLFVIDRDRSATMEAGQEVLCLLGSARAASILSPQGPERGQVVHLHHLRSP